MTATGHAAPDADPLGILPHWWDWLAIGVLTLLALEQCVWDFLGYLERLGREAERKEKVEPADPVAMALLGTTTTGGVGDAESGSGYAPGRTKRRRAHRRKGSANSGGGSRKGSGAGAEEQKEAELEELKSAPLKLKDGRVAVLETGWRRPPPPAEVNFQDVVKVIAILLMFADHWGYFNISASAPREWIHISRAVGRGSAFLFFYLAGSRDRFRFSWATWGWTVLLTVCNVYSGLGLTYTIWETMVSMMFVGRILQWIDTWRSPPHILVVVVMALACVYLKGYTSGKMMYHSGGWLVIIGAWASKRRFSSGHWALVNGHWVLVGAWCYYLYNALSVFSRDGQYTSLIVGMMVLDAALVVATKYVSNKPLGFPLLKWYPVRELILFCSRRAACLYFLHLAIFRLIHDKIQHDRTIASYNAYFKQLQEH